MYVGWRRKQLDYKRPVVIPPPALDEHITLHNGHLPVANIG